MVHWPGAPGTRPGSLRSVTPALDAFNPAAGEGSGFPGPRAGGILSVPRIRGGPELDGSEEPYRAEVPSGHSLARQAHTAAAAAVRVRAWPGDPDAAADRPGDRARP